MHNTTWDFQILFTHTIKTSNEKKTITISLNRIDRPEHQLFYYAHFQLII